MTISEIEKQNTALSKKRKDANKRTIQIKNGHVDIWEKDGVEVGRDTYETLENESFEEKTEKILKEKGLIE